MKPTIPDYSDLPSAAEMDERKNALHHVGTCVNCAQRCYLDAQLRSHCSCENDNPWGPEVDALQEIDADTELREIVPRLNALMRQVTATARGDLKAELALRESMKTLYELSARYEVLRRAVTHFGNLPT